MARRTQPTEHLRSVPTGDDVEFDEDDALQQQFVVTIGDVLKKGTPLDLMEAVSTVVSVLDPRARDPFAEGPDDEEVPTYEMFLESMMDVRLTESSAVLAVLAAVSGDELEATRIRCELTERHHRLPAWLRDLAVEPYRAEQMREVYGDGDNIVVGVRLPSGHEFTVVAYVEHNLGSVVKDAFTVPEPVGETVALFEQQFDDSTDQWFEDLSLADARARLEYAIERGAITYPPFESETWPGCRWLVEWVVRELPAGGTGYERAEWSEHDVQRLADDFFGSEYGRPLDDSDGRSLVESLLWFGTDYGPADPLHWSPTAVEILMVDWLPRKIIADADYLAKAPDVLRAFIRFAHERAGLRSGLTAETVDAVDHWEPEYQQTIRTPRRQGAAALLEGIGALDQLPDEVLGGLGGWDELISFQSIMLGSLESAVGGTDALDRLEAEPLPDEPLDYEPLPDDIHDRVAEVAGLVDQFCDAEMDVEFRTACRRLLGDAAAGDPNIFRRKGAAKTAAAAVCWMVAKANALIGPAMQAQDLVAAFGVKGSVSQRSQVFQQAVGVNPHSQYGLMELGTPRYLTAERRGSIIEQRERFRR